MCGISGIFLKRRASPQSQAEFQSANAAMIARQELRGPDAQGSWSNAQVFLGHTRLAIMDPGNEQSNQPVHNERWVLVYNGEIYNFRKLREDLQNRFNATFATEGDTEVLLSAIEYYGLEEALAHLNGIFAFAAYDKLKHRLYLVRDRLGIKPLYIYEGEDAIWFASSPAAIVHGRGGVWDLDYRALYRYFRLGAPCSRETLFQGIERVSAAELVTIREDGHCQTRRYWIPEYRKDDLGGILRDAVARQQEAHVPSSLFLSGGVDSSVLSLYLEDMDFFHLDSPERKYAEYVARNLDRELRVSAYGDHLEFEEYNRLYAMTSGEPSASAPIPLLVSKAIHEEGYKVAFSANGADELFFGYPRTPAPELRADHRPANNYESGESADLGAQFNHIFRSADSFCVPRLGDARGLRTDDWVHALVPDLGPEFPESAHARWFELQTYVQYDLNPTLDFASMACSLEVRVPFLDHQLIEAALSTDANEMITADYGRKTPLKRVLKAHGLHPLLWARPKVGFSVPEQAMQKRRRILDAAVDDAKAEGLFEISPVCEENSRDHQYLLAAAHAFMVWKRVWVDSGVVRT